MRKLGHSPKVPRPRNKNAQGRKQEAFKKSFPMRLMRLKEKYPTPTVELWAEDEHRIGLKPIIRKVWSPIGQRPTVEVEHRYLLMDLPITLSADRKPGRATG